MKINTPLALAVATVLLGTIPAHAAPRVTLVLGKITSQKSCKVYQESAGKSALVATPYTLATASSWRTWLVKDCVDNFATIRSSLEAALASTNRFSIKTAGSGTYTVIGAISQVGGDGGPAPDIPTGRGGYSVSSRQMFVSMDITVKNAAGRIVYGGMLTKNIETGSSITTPGLQTTSSESGEALYTVLQHEVALAAARIVAFHIDPLRVLSTDDKEIHLNYGSPLLKLGTIVHVTNSEGGTVRYLVTSANSEGATAEVDGERGDWTKVTKGDIADVIEDEDPAAKGRKTKKVELPD